MRMYKEATAIAIQAGIPVLLWGKPGTGKTSFVEALGRELGVPVETVIASIREPSDFSGLPVLHGEEGVKLEPPAWAKRLAESGEGILFLDEISTAPPLVQAALLRVILDGVVGELALPPDVMTIAAANPPEEAAGGWDLAPPLANRFVHIDWGVDVDDWIGGMTIGWKEPDLPVVPEEWTDFLPEVRALIASFVRVRRHLLLQLPNNDTAAGRAWPSPRSWGEQAAKCLAAAKSVDASEDVEQLLLAGSVGEGAAVEFLQWMRNLDLPNPEELLENPEGFELPDTGDKQYAVFSGITAAVANNMTEERWEAAWEILYIGAKEGAADIAAVSARNLYKARDNAGLRYQVPKHCLRAFLPVLRAGRLI